jgi:FSR family fosmidomycin resistance protein-like MFS transporter
MRRGQTPEPPVSVQTPAAAPHAAADTSAATAAASATVFPVLAAISVSHMLNDLIQSLIPAIYPILKQSYALDFGQIGLITLAFQLTASVLQPAVGLYTDMKPLPYSLAVGMSSTLCGLLLLSMASSYPMILASVALVGLGSAVFHPESSRVARMASGGRHGLAQSLFQVGGNAGSALGPLAAAWIVIPHGQKSLGWFSIVALAGILILSGVGMWYARHQRRAGPKKAASARETHGLSQSRVVASIGILAALMFSKFFYMAALGSYFTFYLIERFHVDVQTAQLHLFIFLAAVAAGTIAGGPIGDRFGRKFVIWLSILGVAPFTLALPYVGLGWTTALTIVIGLVLSSAFSAIIVYAQELVPGKVGMIAGLFFGFAFGMGGIGAAVLGEMADWWGIEYVYWLCSFLPLIGLLAIFLPDVERRRAAA